MLKSIKEVITIKQRVKECNFLTTKGNFSLEKNVRNKRQNEALSGKLIET